MTNHNPAVIIFVKVQPAVHLLCADFAWRPAMAGRESEESAATAEYRKILKEN